MKLFCICVVIAISTVGTTFIKNDMIKICLMLVMVGISITFTINQLNKYIDLIDLIKVKFKK